MSGKGAGAGLPVDVRYPVVGSLAGASGCGAVAGAVRPEAVRGEPDDFRVDRDLNDGMAGPVVLPPRTGLSAPARAWFQVPRLLSGWCAPRRTLLILVRAVRRSPGSGRRR
jgi:hypothetical protein